jgi:putative DNA primase/helicase
MIAEAVAKALDGRRAGNGYLCRCPVPTHGKGRGDRNPSLSIRAGDDGKLLVNCMAGCDPRDVLRALGRYEGQAVAPSKVSRFFSPATDLQPVANGDAQPTEPKPFSDAYLLRDRYRFVCSYCYATPDGETLYEVCR